MAWALSGLMNCTGTVNGIVSSGKARKKKMVVPSTDIEHRNCIRKCEPVFQSKKNWLPLFSF